jgi:hypothetical protein
MRRFILVAVALALVLPVAALADRGPSGHTRNVALAKTRHATVRLGKARLAARHFRARREREVRGRVTSLAPLTVGALVCAVPTGVSLVGLHVGDLVELECKLVAGGGPGSTESGPSTSSVGDSGGDGSGNGGIQPLEDPSTGSGSGGSGSGSSSGGGGHG